MRQAILYRGEDGYWVAEVPSLPGCISQGETREEAVANIAEAAELWIETMKDLGERVPGETAAPEVVNIKVA
jgi:predicted RNase H-like HicB family nuclease